MDELSNIIELSDENGNLVKFEFLDLIEYKNEEFVVLLPMEDDDGQVVILKVVAVDEETESYVSCDDKELTAVFEMFKEKFKDYFTFE